jgi:hypothetical protein
LNPASRSANVGWWPIANIRRRGWSPPKALPGERLQTTLSGDVRIFYSGLILVCPTLLPLLDPLAQPGSDFQLDPTVRDEKGLDGTVGYSGTHPLMVAHAVILPDSFFIY